MVPATLVTFCELSILFVLVIYFFCPPPPAAPRGLGTTLIVLLPEKHEKLRKPILIRWIRADLLVFRFWKEMSPGMEEEEQNSENRC